MPNNQYRCVYKADPNYFINLNPVDMVPTEGKPNPNLTLSSLQKTNAALYTKYKTEQDRVGQETAIVYEKIGKSKKLADAFVGLQEAENVRDSNPDAYQKARSRYYTIKEGDKWNERERQRILEAEVQPLAQGFVDTRSKALGQYESQRKTVDVVNGLRDKVLSIKDDVQYAANTFKEQLGNVKNAINTERRGRVKETTVSIWDWFDTLLNLCILGALMYTIYRIYIKYSSTPAVVGGG